MKIIKINKHLVDCFIGDGWKGWSRVLIKSTSNKGKVAKVISGASLPSIRLIEVVKTI